MEYAVAAADDRGLIEAVGDSQARSPVEPVGLHHAAGEPCLADGLDRISRVVDNPRGYQAE